MAVISTYVNIKHFLFVCLISTLFLNGQIIEGHSIIMYETYKVYFPRI